MKCCETRVGLIKDMMLAVDLTGDTGGTETRRQKWIEHAGKAGHRYL